ncbi:MAG: tyrosine-type recombinase/integrase [Candidatus Ventricola sp.]
MSIKRKDNKGRILREGEIQKADGRYEYRYQDVDGRRKSAYSWRLTETDSVPDGKRYCDALRDIEKVINKNVQDGILNARRITLNKRWEVYISSKTNLKKTSVEIYQNAYELYIRHEIGYMSISNITYSVIKSFYAKLVREYGLSLSTMRIVDGILHPLFFNAVRDGYIRLNPTDGVLSDMKKAIDKKEKRQGLTEKQQRAFLTFIQKTPKYRHWYPMFRCLLGTGCRIGEMLALRWDDIDWEENVISVSRTMVYYRSNEKNDKNHISTPKTKNGIRCIPMFGSVRSALEEEYERQTREGFRDDVIDGYTGFIWQSKQGKPLNTYSVNCVIRNIIRDYNETETNTARDENREAVLLPNFTVHNLRHTFCTRICEKEHDLKIIQEIMGHSNITTTMNIYNKTNMHRKKESFSTLEAASDIF